VVRAPHLMHGKTSAVAHDGRTIFQGIPQPMTCTRYHSLIVEESTLPAELQISARVVADDPEVPGLIMAMRHRTLPMEGVQFHPESVLTDHGKQLIANFLRQ
jgi:anthranilate synthase component 2